MRRDLAGYVDDLPQAVGGLHSTAEEGFHSRLRRKRGVEVRVAARWTQNWMTWSPNAISASDFYDRIHCLIHKTGGSRESYGRIVPEAYATGVAVVVEDDFAFPDLVEDGVTGFRCRSSDEMSFRASELAFDEPRRKRMVEKAAHRFLVNEIALARDGVGNRGKA